MGPYPQPTQIPVGSNRDRTEQSGRGELPSCYPPMTADKARAETFTGKVLDFSHGSLTGRPPI